VTKRGDGFTDALISLQPPRGIRSSSVVTLACPPTPSSLKIRPTCITVPCCVERERMYLVGIAKSTNDTVSDIAQHTMAVAGYQRNICWPPMTIKINYYWQRHNWGTFMCALLRVTRTATRSCRTRKRALHVYSPGVAAARHVRAL